MKFYPRFDHIVLLSAPADVLGCLQTVEPLLRRAAGLEIDTSAPLGEVVAKILLAVQPET